MGKYLELFRGEVGDLTEKTKLENKPYVAYSTKLGKVVYTVVPAKDPVVEGPADNEIWYTSTDGSVITLQNTIGYKIISHTYENGKGIITFNESVTRITCNSFWNCYKMDSIVLPNSVIIIEGGAFPECKSLVSITIPNSVVEIGRDAFNCCTSLTSITIPNSVTVLERNVFYGCKNLLSINFEGTIEEWNSVHKDSNWTCDEGTIPATVVHCIDGDVEI